MTSLGDWMGEQLLGDDARPGGTWLDVITELRDQHGSNRAVARATGLNESTVRRILSGKTKAPKAGTLETLRGARLRADRPGDNDISLKTMDRDSSRERTLTNDNLKLTPGTMAACAEVWRRTGDIEAAAARFLEGVTVPFYRTYLKPREGALSPAETPTAGTGTGAGTGAGGAGDGGDEYGFSNVYVDAEGVEYVFSDIPDDYDGLEYEDVFGPDDADYGAEVVG